MRSPQKIIFRSGLILNVQTPLSETWGEVFEASIANVYCLNRCKPFDLVVDIGANIGAFTCFAKYSFPNCSVIAYEPSNSKRQKLLLNLSENSFKKITVRADPVTGDGRDVVFSEIGFGGSSSIYLTGPQKILLGSQTLNLDELNSYQRVFIKLDCEGAEGEIISWLCKNYNFINCSLKIVCEYHPWCPIPVSVSLQKLISSGFVASTHVRFSELYLEAEKPEQK